MSPSHIWISLILTATVRHVHSDIDFVTRMCREDWCYSLDHDNESYTSEEYYLSLFKLFSSGIPQLIYEELEQVIPKVQDLSSTCRNSFSQVSKALNAGQEWAFRLIDSSGKTPSGFTESTVTSLGDYDECLAIKSPSNVDIRGKYCLIDVFPIGYKNGEPRKDGKISLNQMQHFNKTTYYFGICFPSKCSTQDVKSIMKSVLKPYPLMPEGDLHCDTQETNTMAHRFKHISFGSALSLFYLAMIGVFLFIGTLNHIFRPVEANQSIWGLKSFSIIENIHKLLVVDDSTQPLGFLQSFKMSVILFGVCAHILSCIESGIGFFVLSHHKNLERIISDPLMAPFFGDAGIGMITALSGFGTFIFAYPLAKQGKLPIIAAVIDKCLRLLPALISIIALDFVWYLPLDGPFVGRVGKTIIQKCSQTWWKTILFVSNLWGNSLEICAGHTYSTAVDVQLFILGLICVSLLAKRPKLGLLLSTGCFITGCSLIVIQAYINKLTPTLIVAKNPDFDDMERFFYYVHMATSNYMPSYFLSLLTAYSIEIGVWKKFAVKVNHISWWTAITICNLIIQFDPALVNYFDVIPKRFNALFILTNRLVMAIEMALIFIYISLLEENGKNAPKAETKDENANEVQRTTPDAIAECNNDGAAIVKLVGTERYSVVRAFFRLSFAVYMSNYFFIRTDFYTSRTIFYNSFYVYIKRLVSSFAFIMVTAFCFQLFYISPFMNLMNELKGKTKKKTKAE